MLDEEIPSGRRNVPQANFGRGRVYVIDDEVEVRDSLQVLLGTLGYNVETVQEPLAFLSDVSSHLPGVILLDVRMPDINGLEFLEILNVTKARFSVIVMSGHGDIELAVRALHMGAKDFLEKPLREDVLTKVLDREMGRLASEVDSRKKAAGAVEVLNRLTDREKEVLERLMAGKSNKVIAFELGISVRTAEMHRARMMYRLGCKSLVDAISLYHMAQAEAPDSGLDAPV